MEVVNTTSTTDPVNMYNYLNTYIMNPMVLVVIVLIIIVIVIIKALRSSNCNNNYKSMDE